MLFNSYTFILVFLPITWIGYQAAQTLGPRVGARGAVIWLSLASFLFYGYWSPRFLLLLLFSIIVNFALGSCLSRIAQEERWLRRLLLTAGIGFNLLLLGYFKYTNFLVDNLNVALGLDLVIGQIVLPIGISFFTFQQIAFLVDGYRGDTDEYDFVQYCLFVTFFPQLIAGPIVHHKEMMPQFARGREGRIAPDVAIGLTIFTIGLFKKVVIADTMAVDASGLFESVAAGYRPNLIEAWAGVLCYTFQIYFDFSGYSDMAIGLGRLFGIRLPVNFASPYKAASITEFWQRWHITLSRFLRDYLYIPLGGNRRGKPRQYANLLVTMVIGGIWHGAGWTFVIWGALHGFFLVANRLWRDLRNQHGAVPPPWFGRGLTCVCVMIAWVPFRAADLATMVEVYRSMLGLNGIVLPGGIAMPLATLFPDSFTTLGLTVGNLRFIDLGRGVILLSLLLVVWFLPNTQEWMRRVRPSLPTAGYPATLLRNDAAALVWSPTLQSALIVGLVFGLCLVKLNDVSPFIYFQF